VLPWCTAVTAEWRGCEVPVTYLQLLWRLYWSICFLWYVTLNTVCMRSIILDLDENFLKCQFHMGKQYKYVRCVWTAGFILDSKRTCRRPFKLRKNLGKIVVRFEISKKSLAWLGINGSNITKLLHLHLYKMTGWQTQRYRLWSKTEFCDLFHSGGIGWRK